MAPRSRSLPRPGPQGRSPYGHRKGIARRRSLPRSTSRPGSSARVPERVLYLGYTAVDEETGEEVERIEALPCRRCAEEARWIIGLGHPSRWPALLGFW